MGKEPSESSRNGISLIVPDRKNAERLEKSQLPSRHTSELEESAMEEFRKEGLQNMKIGGTRERGCKGIRLKFRNRKERK